MEVQTDGAQLMPDSTLLVHLLTILPPSKPGRLPRRWPGGDALRLRGQQRHHRHDDEEGGGSDGPAGREHTLREGLRPVLYRWGRFIAITNVDDYWENYRNNAPCNGNRSLFLFSSRFTPRSSALWFIRAWWTSSTGYEADLDTSPEWWWSPLACGVRTKPYALESRPDQIGLVSTARRPFLPGPLSPLSCIPSPARSEWSRRILTNNKKLITGVNHVFVYVLNLLHIYLICNYMRSSSTT